MMRNLPRFLALGALLIGSVFVSSHSTTLAQVPPPGRPPPGAPAVSSEVTIEVIVVHATNAHSDVDDKLPESFLRARKYFNFSGFTHLESNSQSLSLKQETTFSVAGGYKVKVQLLDRNDEEAKIRVRMFNGSSRMLDTTISIHRNRSFVVSGPHHDGGILMLPFTANY